MVGEQTRLLLESPPASRNSDPLSSFLAEDEHTASGSREANCRAILRDVIAHPGSTSVEIAARVANQGIGRVEVSRRLSELRDHHGLVYNPAGYTVCSIRERKMLAWHPVETP